MTATTVTARLPVRPLGPTGLMVTPVAIGCAPLGDMPKEFAYGVPEEQALETMRAVFAPDSPINFVDTAASYGDGESERRIGIVLKELGGLPEGFVLATKADRDLQTGDFSGEQMRRSVERSLRLLGLDRLQLVYLHDPEWSTFEEIMAPGGAVEALQGLRDEGLIEHLGVAGGPIDLTIQYIETGAFTVVITHNRYTLLNRSAEPAIALAASKGYANVNAAPYGSGLLAKGPESYPRYCYQTASAAMLDRVRRMADICKTYGVPLAAAALQFSIRDPRVGSTIVGMTKPERLAQTGALATYPIPDELWPELDAVGYETGDPETERWK